MRPPTWRWLATDNELRDNLRNSRFGFNSKQLQRHIAILHALRCYSSRYGHRRRRCCSSCHWRREMEARKYWNNHDRLKLISKPECMTIGTDWSRLSTTCRPAACSGRTIIRRNASHNGIDGWIDGWANRRTLGSDCCLKLVATTGGREANDQTESHANAFFVPPRCGSISRWTGWHEMRMCVGGNRRQRLIIADRVSYFVVQLVLFHAQEWKDRVTLLQHTCPIRWRRQLMC